ncbi:MAG: PfkB family carbohydrate kinase [Candidatus Omnitrophica bacterium]|nr:PfkB family carbohydrate kinase [Candidatus Omnitrophota bacterium]
MSILVVGSVAIDSVKTPFGKREEALGGSATYFSMAASFFNKVNIVATVGEDFPKKYINLFKNKGIGTDGLHVARGKTFRWKGWYDYDLNTAHTVSTHLNVFKDFKPDVPRALRKSEFVFLANIDPELQYNVLKQMDHPKLVACDSMNYWLEHKKKEFEKLLDKVDILLLNDSEARQFTGEPNLMRAARLIVDFGPKAVIIKKGEHGVIYFSKDSHFIAPAYLLETVYDPTGAGDTFAGGMIGYLSKVGKVNEASVRKSIIYGSILASFVVEGFSVDRMLEISTDEINLRYKHFKEITKF